MLPELPSPWREFLTELDDLLNEPCELHCIGGFAVVAVYGLPRSTNDLDYYSIVPQHCTDELERIAGEGSDLARKHKVHVHHASVASLPESYEERMTELFAGRFKNLRLLVLDPYDLVLSKLSRNVERDREDVEYVVKTQHLDAAILRARYEQELKPYLIGPVERHDNSIKFWIEAYFNAP
ncbi:MAG: DUF6036 family nucleotidyltransferase [Candidatus Acidiferrales bacterium]